MAEAGGFDHNAHTLRLLTRLESPYPRFDGLNLSWETLEGLAKHNGPVAGPCPGRWPRRMPNSTLELDSWPGLEAQVAAIADDIAYDNHDIDDGLRAGLFTLDELLEVPLAAEAWAAVRARYPDVADGAADPGTGARADRADGQRRARRDGGASRRRASARSRRCAAPGRQLAGFSPDMAAAGAGAEALPLRPYVRRAGGEGGAGRGAGDPRRPVRRLSRRSGPAARGMAARLGRSGARHPPRSATSSPA